MQGQLSWTRWPFDPHGRLFPRRRHQRYLTVKDISLLVVVPQSVIYWFLSHSNGYMNWLYYSINLYQFLERHMFVLGHFESLSNLGPELRQIPRRSGNYEEVNQYWHRMIIVHEINWGKIRENYITLLETVREDLKLELSPLITDMVC